MIPVTGGGLVTHNLLISRQFWKITFAFQDPKLAELTEMGYLIALPDRDKHGRRVIYSKAGAFDATRFTTSDMMRAHIMTFETLLNDEENQVRI